MDDVDRSGSVLDGEWRLDGIIGRGATSLVYSAQHVSGRRGAMKIMHRAAASDHEQRLRFRDEARLAASIRAPNVIEVWGSATTEDGVPVIAMELLEGMTLGRYVRRCDPSVLRVVNIAQQLLDAVQACHRASILHRDLKPSNVFIQRDGTAKLLDFGVAKLMSLHGGATPMLAIGTPSYMAPEQARAQLQDARTDVFGVGATLYAVFTGAGPHDGDDECALDRAARQSPSPLLMAAPNLPRALARAIDRAMAHDPSRRWQTAQELRDALNPIARALSRERSASKPALARVKTPRATQTAVTTMRENRETDQPISGSAAVWAGRRPSARTTRDRTA